MKRKRRRSVPRNELFLQFSLTYSIMTMILIVSLLLMHGLGKMQLNAVLICGTAIEAYSPTTITFVGTVLINKYYNKEFIKHSLRSTLLIILLVTTSLFYVAFTSLKLGNETNDAIILGIANIAIVILASVVVFSSTKSQNVGEANTDESCRNTSDGSICATYRHL